MKHWVSVQKVGDWSTPVAQLWSTQVAGYSGEGGEDSDKGTRGAYHLHNPSGWEVFSVNIQFCSLFKRKREISENVLVSNGKVTKKIKDALIKPVAFNF